MNGHCWETGSDGWGVVFGVSRCKVCGAVATQERLRQACPEKPGDEEP